MKFRESCSLITGKEQLFDVVLSNKVLSVTQKVSIHNVSLECGSIIATFQMSGPYKTAQTSYVDLALDDLWTAIQNSMSLKISGATFSAAIEMKVDGKNYRPVTNTSPVSAYCILHG